MQLPKEQVEHITRPFRLDLSPEEIEKFSRKLTVIPGYFSILHEVDVEGMNQSRPLPGAVVLRKDVAEPSLPRKQTLVHAQDSVGELFRVPKVID